jgi:hypothetical protein
MSAKQSQRAGAATDRDKARESSWWRVLPAVDEVVVEVVHEEVLEEVFTVEVCMAARHSPARAMRCFEVVLEWMNAQHNESTHDAS